MICFLHTLCLHFIPFSHLLLMFAILAFFTSYYKAFILSTPWTFFCYFQNWLFFFIQVLAQTSPQRGPSWLPFIYPTPVTVTTQFHIPDSTYHHLKLYCSFVWLIPLKYKLHEWRKLINDFYPKNAVYRGKKRSNLNGQEKPLQSNEDEW